MWISPYSIGCNGKLNGIQNMSLTLSKTWLRFSAPIHTFEVRQSNFSSININIFSSLSQSKCHLMGFVLPIRSKRDERFRIRKDKRILTSSIYKSRRYCSCGCFLPSICRYLNITHTPKSAINISEFIDRCWLSHVFCYIYRLQCIVDTYSTHSTHFVDSPSCATQFIPTIYGIYLKHIIEFETFISCVPKIIHKLVVLILWNYSHQKRARFPSTFSPISHYKSLFRPTFSPKKLFNRTDGHDNFQRRKKTSRPSFKYFKTLTSQWQSFMGVVIILSLSLFLYSIQRWNSSPKIIPFYSTIHFMSHIIK